MIPTILSGLFNFIGGESWGKKIIKKIGCPLCMIWVLYLKYGIGHLETHAISLSISFVLAILAVGTYWDTIPPKEIDKFWLHGFMIGLAFFPYAIDTGGYIPMIIRSGMCAITMGFISDKFSNVFVEAFGRGVIMTGTVYIL